MLLGYPNDTGELSAAIGRVLSDEEAEGAVARLAEWGDAEGAIPYEADVEAMIEAEAAPGMSGGPVVDREGCLVAALVRASEVHDGVQYVRAVRLSWVSSRLEAAFLELSPEAQERISGFLEP